FRDPEAHGGRIRARLSRREPRDDGGASVAHWLLPAAVTRPGSTLRLQGELPGPHRNDPGAGARRAGRPLGYALELLRLGGYPAQQRRVNRGSRLYLQQLEVIDQE